MKTNTEGLKTAILIVENKRSLIKKDIDTLDNAKRLIGDKAVSRKKESLVDTLCELTILKSELGDLL